MNVEISDERVAESSFRVSRTETLNSRIGWLPSVSIDTNTGSRQDLIQDSELCSDALEFSDEKSERAKSCCLKAFFFAIEAIVTSDIDMLRIRRWKTVDLHVAEQVRCGV